MVCDDIIECAEDMDEKLCRTGADKYNPIAYGMTAGAGMIYVVLKLVWFFYQRHQPIGDVTMSRIWTLVDCNGVTDSNLKDFYDFCFPRFILVTKYNHLPLF